jgi:HK97 family phage major capsid protein/HK97 family phage prohead protease
MAEMVYQQRATPPPGDKPDVFVLSDGSIDRMGDIIDPAGWQLDRLLSDPLVLWNHHRDHVLGRWTDIAVRGGQLLGRIVWDESGKSPLVEHIRALVRQGILRTVSVGFRPLEREPLDDKADKWSGPFRFTKTELLECSLVSVPANPNALAIARDFPRAVIDEVFCKPADPASLKLRRASPSEALAKEGERLGETRAAHGKPAKPPSNASRPTTMTGTLSAKIKAAHDTYNSLRDRLAELVAVEEPNEEEARRADELPGEIDDARSAIARLERQERALAESIKAEAVPPREVKHGEILEPRKPFPLPAKRKVEPGDYVYRALAAWSSAQGSHDSLDNVLRERYGNDEQLSIVLRAAVNPAMTTVAGWAAELVQTQNVGFLDRLLPSFIYPSLASAGTKYTFSNQAAQIKIPTRTTTSTLAGAWVGEGAPKPVKKLSLSSITLTPFKLAVISVFSEEMALYSTPAIEGIIRDAMSNDTGVSLDTYLIDATAASSTRPAGLLNGVTPLTATATGTNTEKMIADLKQLIAALVASGSNGNNVHVLVNPAQALSLSFAMTTTGDFLFDGAAGAGQRFGVTFHSSATVAAGRVIAVDANEFATMTGDTPRFSVSNEAALHMEDTSPLQIATGPQGTAVVATPTTSLFQTDCVAIRMHLYVTWAMRRTGFVQTIASVGW